MAACRSRVGSVFSQGELCRSAEAAGGRARLLLDLRYPHMKLAIVRASAIVGVGLFLCQAATRDMTVVPPTAVATVTSAGYCFARIRGLDPGRLPQSYLVLQLKVAVSYHNSWGRGLIVPLERKRSVYTSTNPDEMSKLKETTGLFDAELKVMKDLPAGVSPDSPISPKNDVFTVIPAGGDMTPPFSEEITVPVSPRGLFKQSADLRGHRLYVELRFLHRDMSAALGTDLSDRWSRFGFPWTGILTTNKVVVDIPASPQANGLCVDTLDLHPVVNADSNK